jgi:hypothetical protein
VAYEGSKIEERAIQRTNAIPEFLPERGDVHGPDSLLASQWGRERKDHNGAMPEDQSLGPAENVEFSTLSVHSEKRECR